MTDYFSHDVEASDDIKIQELQMDMGGQGYAIWWRLLELLWKNGGKMKYKPALLAYNLRWATAEEISQVVENYDLFTIQDGQFWNEAQLARRQEKDALCEERKAAARTAASARWKDRASEEQAPKNTPADAPVMRDVCDTDATRNADAMPNKLINKLINKSLSDACAGAPAHERSERERIFFKFFFKNYKNPAQEVARYWSNYSGLGWKTNRGAPIEDRVAYADNWKPQEEGANFRDATALRWWREVYEYAEAQRWPYADAIPLALTDIARDSRDLSRLIVVFSDKEAGSLIKQFIKDSGLDAAHWSGISYQLGKNRINQ